VSGRAYPASQIEADLQTYADAGLIAGWRRSQLRKDQYEVDTTYGDALVVRAGREAFLFCRALESAARRRPPGK
jgi:hypothetical protein